MHRWNCIYKLCKPKYLHSWEGAVAATVSLVQSTHIDGPGDRNSDLFYIVPISLLVIVTLFPGLAATTPDQTTFEVGSHTTLA